MPGRLLASTGSAEPVLLSCTNLCHWCWLLLLLLQHELDLLVSSTPDGQLVLSDCFCLDTVVSMESGASSSMCPLVRKECFECIPLGSTRV